MLPRQFKRTNHRDFIGREWGKKATRQRSLENFPVDVYNMWQARSKEEEQIFRAVRNSDIFSQQRAETFVKFNYRSIESKDLTYDQAFESVLLPKQPAKGLRHMRGSMHVSELWSDQNLLELMGSLPFPKDRLKILNAYKIGKDLRIKVVKSKLKQKIQSKEN